jgi:hypothetical protein
MIAVMKRPSTQPADRDHIAGELPLAAWHPDPTKRHEQRFWNGSEWTERVEDNHVESIDHLGAVSTD